MTVTRETNRMGIIYFAWQGKAIEQEDVKVKLDAKWRGFAEQVMTEQDAVSTTGLSKLWMRDDLFVCLALPPSRFRSPEEELLTLGSRLKLDWEERFMAAAFGGAIPELKLHAGVSFLDGSILSEEERLYDGIKRAIIHGQPSGATERSLKRRALEHILMERLIHPVYQPIISLQCGTEAAYGYEALSRLPDRRWFDGPLQLFDFASEEGMTYSLDRLARERAIEGSAGLSAGQKLFINITAKIMNDPSFTTGRTMLLLEQYGLSPHHVVFEITERSSIEDFGAAKKILQHYRTQGYQIAIDDAGAGYSSLQSIVELEPDYIKIDRSLIHGIHQDSMKAHLVQTFTELAAKMGISLVAEGIEEESELHYIKSIGVHYAQGYLLGRPQPSIA
ncbi:EAL domain-containing protein [Paenibacillus sp. BC26]|uniref:EAL domain-containing protein n=1 Tax=Paenibacillus sp. BC26 TaxID=1881032 RepID=UPI0008F3900D|nr:EAL domain-containing protein [Paenibacillus sp. BC26]SFS56771.1 EAL domain, c-di-GMP-specific phosphodiesterase class I (or its enzymatically inactive variant) [Paenibacillus sp. BC26]